MIETNKINDKPKSKIIALILSIIALGGGYFYIGKVKLAILFAPFIVIFHFTSVYVASVINNAYFLIICNIITILLIISSYIIPIILIHKKNYLKTKYSNWKYLFLFVIVINIFDLVFLEAILNKAPARAFKIPAKSMANTIKINDQLIAYKTKDIRRGDLIIFKYPNNPNIFYLKRLIATEGDVIALKDKHILLHLKEGNEYIKTNYLDSEKVKIGNKLFIVDPYKKKFEGIHTDTKVINNGLNPYNLFNMNPIKIPKNEYFAMGDNRDHSNDSRFWGTIPKELIYGKTNLIHINWDDLNRINKKIK